ncbi:MAG TPA: nitroreductase [Caldilineaceae bacterium]|nr:nitroreductase [Caldilineaceae bacterium]
MYETNGTSVTTALPRQQSLETIDLLLTRRSVVAAKQCEPGPTAEELNTILRCATRVPDHKKLAPWRIQVVQGAARSQLGEKIADIFCSQNPDATEHNIAFERERFLRAPLVLIVSTKIVDESRCPRWEQILSGAAVCQNILIAATALGYASQWLSEWPAYDAAVKAAFNIAPSDEILGFMYIGSAAEKPDERDRPALDKVVEFL